MGFSSNNLDLHVATIVTCLMGTMLISEALPLAAKGKSSKEFLDSHNAVRAEVGVGPMRWNKTLSGYARKYALSRIGSCEMEHSGGPYGENLSEGFGYVRASDAVKFWASEKPHYDYASNKCVGDECRHYTQLVWRDSVNLGCARAKCLNGWMFVICNYYPPGNYDGERPY
ncbi:hypothetical protein UlMin_030614 [Ulmus minor]